MEPVTHLAAGLLTAQALRPWPPNRRTHARGLTLLCAAAATIPDLDSLVGLLSPEFYLLYHRGLTHSLVLLPALALLLALAARGLTALGPRTLGPSARLPLGLGFFAASLALGTHLFLDVVTAFGTQLFAPFSDRRVSFEGLYVVDPPFALALLGFVLAGWLRPARARVLALWGIALLLAYPLAGNLLRLDLQQRYEALLQHRGQAYDSVTLAPDPLAPWYWRVIVASGPELLVTTATPLNLDKPFPVLRLRRVDRAELVSLGRTASIFRTYAWFAGHPAELPPSPGERHFVDAAFIRSGPVLTALFDQGPGFAQCDALFDEAGRLAAWRDWNGKSHALAGAGPQDARAQTPARP